MKTITAEEGGFSGDRLQEINNLMHRYIENGQAAGISAAIYRRGGVCYFDKAGHADLESQRPIEDDTIFRIYSMTKPITSVAIMMLWERGALRLNDPLLRFLPKFKEMDVLISANERVAANREITIKDLLTHTSGLSYANFENPAPAEVYAESDLMFTAEHSTEEFFDKLAELPLLFHPGEEWHYSLATDVLGRVVEVASGLEFEAFLKENIFDPLGMIDTHFTVPTEKTGRFATLYGEMDDGSMGLIPNSRAGDYTKAGFKSGGGGLISTMADYMQFAKMILHKGELDGVRLLGRKTVEYMTGNFLPESILPIALSNEMPGVGFGLGFNHILDPAAVGVANSTGNHGWGGWASTTFWVDPVEEMIGLLMVQYIPQNDYFLGSDFRTAVYQALVD